jgi:hypothetical protein
MFKTALRISVLAIIVAGAFYCGRATTSAKSNPTPAPAVASPALFPLVAEAKDAVPGINVEFQLQKSMPIAASADSSPLPNTPSTKKTRAPNHPDMFYYLEWDEEGKCYYYQGQKIDTLRDFLLYNKWCRPGQRLRNPCWNCEYLVAEARRMHYALEIDADNNRYTYNGEELNKDREQIKEVFQFLPFAR